nr:MAG TPA: hypothetical protein [Microviridae sp.]
MVKKMILRRKISNKTNVSISKYHKEPKVRQIE